MEFYPTFLVTRISSCILEQIQIISFLGLYVYLAQADPTHLVATLQFAHSVPILHLHQEAVPPVNQSLVLEERGLADH